MEAATRLRQEAEAKLAQFESDKVAAMMEEMNADRALEKAKKLHAEATS